MGILTIKPEFEISQCRRTTFAFLAILVLLLSVYANTFHSSWHFDDEPNILENKGIHLTELNWKNIQNTFFASLGGTGEIYRPVACFTFAINHYLGKNRVFGYHVFNLAVHFFASIFLFLFIYLTLNLPLLKARYGPNSYFIAFLAAVFWAINPIQTQAITYIVQRMASLAGMFYIMGMYFYLKARIATKNPLKAGHYFMCIICGFLAIGSKENAAMFPISILIFDLFLIQGITKTNIKKTSVILVAMILVPLTAALILKGFSVFDLKHLISSYGHRSFTLSERLLTEPRVILFYISLLFYPMPTRLCIAHDISPSHSLIDPPTTLLAILFILTVLALVTIKSKKWPLVSYCILFFFLNHLIEASIFPLELVFEHRNYIPSMLFFVPIIILIIKGMETYSKKTLQVSFCLFLILVLVGFGHSTFIRNAIWKTEESLWLDAVDKYPASARAHHNLGRYYANTNQKEKAIDEYKLALNQARGTHGETHHMTHYNLGLVYHSMNLESDAESHLLKAIEIFPRYADAYNNLSIVVAEQGRYGEAYDYLITSLTYDRNSPLAHNNLGYILIKQDRIEEAISELQQALELDKDYRTSLHNLGIAYNHKGDLQAAARCFRSVLDKDPKALFTQLYLAYTYVCMGKSEAAQLLLSHCYDLLSSERLYEALKIYQQEDPFQELPPRKIILPMLGKIYLEKAGSLDQMGKALLNGLE
ncbi:tetratricopeptide repeat protein [bacterium]|nr:tetratricopeptide repeat protein [bacterium]